MSALTHTLSLTSSANGSLISVMFSANRIINPTLSERKSRFQAPLILWICLWIGVLLAFLPFNNLRRGFLVISSPFLLHLRFSSIFPDFLFIWGRKLCRLTSAGRALLMTKARTIKTNYFQCTQRVCFERIFPGISILQPQLKGKSKCFHRKSPRSHSQNKLH